VIKIFAFTSNRSDLIELQLKSFRKHIQEEFTFTIFNSRKFDYDRTEYPKINEECERLGIPVFDVEKDDELIARCNAAEPRFGVFNAAGKWSNNNCAGNYSACYVWEKFMVKESGPVCLLHPDLFFIKPIKLTDYLKDTPLCFMPQTRPNLGGIHMHDALVLADMVRLPEPEKIFWWGSKVNGIDTDIGGQSFFYLQRHPEINPTLIQQWFREDDPTTDFHPSEYEDIGINDEVVALHYLRASNWNHRPEEYHVKKTAWIKKRLGLEG
jgi:hypothetical protein